MLIFVPLAVGAEYLDIGGAAGFAFAALACVPLSYWLGQATEALASRLGPVSGGLLNATFGNAAELMISIFALTHGLFVVVRTALIGSILGQLLLVLGTSLLIAGLKHGELRFSKSLVQVNFTLIVMALLVIGLPAGLMAVSREGGQAGIGPLIPVLSVLLLLGYCLTVFFSLRSQPEDSGESGPPWSVRKAIFVLAVTTGGMIMISELLVSSITSFVESSGISEVFVGLMLIPIFGNVVDHIVAITVAVKNKMDLSLTISVGSAAQVAALILPLVVLVGYATGGAASMVFAPVEVIALAAGLALMVPVLLDGSSNWLEGTQLLLVYVIIGAVLWVV